MTKNLTKDNFGLINRLNQVNQHRQKIQLNQNVTYLTKNLTNINTGE